MNPDLTLSRALGFLVGGLTLVVFALAWGFAVATNWYPGQLVVVGMLMGLFLLALPLRLLLVILLLVTFVVQGMANYFLHLRQAQWLPYLLCILLAVRAVEMRNPVASQTAGVSARPAWSSAPVVCLLVYLFALASAAVIFRAPVTQTVVALKNALPIWVAAALLYQAGRIPDLYDRIWTVIRFIFFLQLPLVLYQHFYIVPRRRDALTSGADAVVGSFGGQIESGGANATLVVFTMLVMALQLGLWLRRECSTVKLLGYWVVGLVIVLSGEVKASLIWLPLIIFYVCRRRILSSFGNAFAALAVTVVMIGALYAAYSTLYWQHYKADRHGDLTSRAEYFFDPTNVNYETGEISRGASIALWAQDSRANLATRLIGYGPGASRISATGGLGVVAQRYVPLQISSTAMALVLWDSGLLGATAFFCLILFTLLMHWRLSRSPQLSAKEQAGADALGAIALVMLSLFFYNTFMNDEPSMQLLLATAVGMGLYWRSKARVQERPQGQAAPKQPTTRIEQPAPRPEPA